MNRFRTIVTLASVMLLEKMPPPSVADVRLDQVVRDQHPGGLRADVDPAAAGLVRLRVRVGGVVADHVADDLRLFALGQDVDPAAPAVALGYAVPLDHVVGDQRPRGDDADPAADAMIGTPPIVPILLPAAVPDGEAAEAAD